MILKASNYLKYYMVIALIPLFISIPKSLYINFDKKKFKIKSKIFISKHINLIYN